jgi:hypothetical protein
MWFFRAMSGSGLHESAAANAPVNGLKHPLTSPYGQVKCDWTQVKFIFSLNIRYDRSTDFLPVLTNWNFSRIVAASAAPSRRRGASKGGLNEN